MDAETQELLISAKAAALQMADNMRILKLPVSKNPTFMRLMAAITAFENCQSELPPARSLPATPGADDGGRFSDPAPR